MRCYVDAVEMGQISEENRYCPQCGARLFQDCPYCGAGNSVYQQNCVACGKPFLHCPTCHILYHLDTMACTNTLSHGECASPLQEYGAGYSAPLANLQRTNILEARPLPAGAGDQRIEVTNTLPISSVVTRHGWLFCGAQTAGRTPQARLRGFRQQDGQDVWAATKLTTMPLWEGILTAYQQYLSIRIKDSILVYKLLDGQEVLRIDTPCVAYHEAILGTRLIIFGRLKNDRQQLSVYDVVKGAASPYRVDETLPPALPRSASLPYPVLMNERLYFIDCNGRLLLCDAEGAVTTVWENADQFRVYQIAAMKESLLALVSDGQQFAVVQIHLHPRADSRQIRFRVQRLNLASEPPSFALCPGDRIVVVQKEALALYDLNNPLKSAWEYPLLPNSSVQSYFAVTHEDQLYLVYLLRQSTPAQYSVRWCVVADYPKEGNLQLFSLASRPSIAYANGQVLSVDRQAGHIYRVKFPA